MDIPSKFSFHEAVEQMKALADSIINKYILEQ